MLKKILKGILIFIIAFIGYVSTRESAFRYERSGVIVAPPEKIYPYLSQFRLGSEWSPWEKMDPSMAKVYSEKDGEVGSTMTFDGDPNVGSGKLEILKLVPNKSVDVRLTMVKPFTADNLVQYALTPTPEGTKFTWSMSGDGGFVGKLITVFIDCEQMVGEQFDLGIATLKVIVEAQD